MELSCNLVRGLGRPPIDGSSVASGWLASDLAGFWLLAMRHFGFGPRASQLAEEATRRLLYGPRAATCERIFINSARPEKRLLHIKWPDRRQIVAGHNRPQHRVRHGTRRAGEPSSTSGHDCQLPGRHSPELVPLDGCEGVVVVVEVAEEQQTVEPFDVDGKLVGLEETPRGLLELLLLLAAAVVVVGIGKWFCFNHRRRPSAGRRAEPTKR